MSPGHQFHAEEHTLKSCWLLVIGVCIGQLAVAFDPSGAAAGVIVGTFDSGRAGVASLANGLVTTQSRHSLSVNFPGTKFVTTGTITPAFLAGVDVLAITSVKDTVGITPLSASEQSALFNFALQGGNVLLLADGLSPYLAAAQSMVGTFGLTIVDDGVSNSQLCTPLLSAHPLFDGPFGQTTSFSMLGAGNFSSLGPYATDLGNMNSTGLPVLAVIERGVLGPGSGRVVIYSDATLFADPLADGFFSASETLFLNSVQYLVPEPTTFVLSCLAIVGLLSRLCFPQRHASRPSLWR